MIIHTSKCEVQRPKSSQRGAINTWYLKVREKTDHQYQSSQNVQSNVQNNIEYNNQMNQNSKIIVQIQENVRNISNIKQNSQLQFRNIPLQQINNLTKINKNSPERDSPQSCSNLDESPFTISQKSKRPTSQLMHILYNKNKNIRQLYASQLGNNVFQDERHIVKMKEMKEKHQRASSERSKKINSLLQEENKSNINTNNLLNQKQQIINNNSNNVNNSSSVKKQQTLQDFYRGTSDLNENKYRVFADYQSYIANQNNNISTNAYTSNNINTRSQQLSQQSQHHINTQLNTSRQIITNIPTQTALNRVIKQQLNQIQQGMASSDNFSKNNTSAKRASRDQFQQKLPCSHRGFIRTTSMICSTIVPQIQNIKKNKKNQPNSKCINIFDEDKLQFNKSIDNIEENQQQINISQLLNILPLDTEMTPSMIIHEQKNNQQEDEFDNDTISRKVRQISNPTLRKKFQTSTGLLMKNFLLKEKTMNENKQNKTDRTEDRFFSNQFIYSDGSQRQKGKNMKQKSAGNLQKINDGNLNNIKYAIIDKQFIKDNDISNPITLQNFANTQQNFQNKNDNQCNQQHNIKKFYSNLSPIKRSQTQYNQFAGNLYNIQRQHTVNFTEEDSLIEKYSNDNINSDLQENSNMKSVNSRPSSSQSKSQQTDLIFQKFQSQNVQRSQSPTVVNLPSTARIPNFTSIASQVNQNRLLNSNSLSQTIKQKTNIQQNQQQNLQINNFGDLKSWENSVIDETSQIELN